MTVHGDSDSCIKFAEEIKEKIGFDAYSPDANEIIEVCSSVKGVVPIVDLGHVHARCNGCLKKQEDFKEIFEKLKTLKLEYYIMHVTGVLYENGNEQYHLPIKKGDMPLAPLIEVILDNNYNITLISESPLLEHDAVYMRLQVEKAIMKRTGKDEADYRDFSEVL